MINRTMLTFLPFLMISLCCRAQSDDPEFLSVKTYELKVKTLPPASLQFPFKSIKIIDSRFDTSKIGFLFSHRFFKDFYRPYRLIKLKNGLQTNIEKFLNDYYQHNFINNNHSLLIVIKKLWMTNVSSNALEQTNEFGPDFLNEYVYAKFEYYAEVDNRYIPLKRIDTLFQNSSNVRSVDYDYKEESSLPFLCFSLENMIENMNYKDYFDFLTNKRSYTLSEIMDRNLTEKNIPVLKEQLRTGVYLTFEEFKKNQPAITVFTKNKIAKERTYELFDGNKNKLLHYFACFDGSQLEMPFPLALLVPGKTSQVNPVARRVGNTFEFYEIIGNRNAGTKYLPNSHILILSDKNLSMVPRQIDMESGAIY